MRAPTWNQSANKATVTLLGVALLLCLAPPGAAQVNDFCLDCHSDPDLTGEREGREINVFVDQSVYDASIHGVMDCTDCHADLASDDFHDEEVEAVDCGMCHDEAAEELAMSRHAGTVSCSGCHGIHDIEPAGDRPMACES